MKRLITGLIMVPVFFYFVVLAPNWLFLVALASVGVLCLYEYLGIAAATFPHAGDLRRNPLGYAAGLFLLVLPNQEAMFLTLLALLAMLLSLRLRDLSAVLPASASLVLGVVYIFGAWRCATLLRAIDAWWLLFALAINWLGDSFAYYFGRAFGRHKMAPSISPAKSWEGAAASVIAAIVFGGLFLHWRFPSLPLVQIGVLCAAANLSGQLGDLAESAIKRGGGVKDSGNSLPGHGGWLDRVDSSLFSVPVVYWLLQQPWFQR
jgi:phosphatidate cytidylyltransferase